MAAVARKIWLFAAIFCCFFPRDAAAGKHTDNLVLAWHMARDNGLSPSLIAALVWRESSGNHRLVSAGSYYGLMQLTPREARRYGVGDKAVLKPRYNLEAGLSLLKDLLDENGNDEALALYAFNRGHAASSPRKARKNPYVKRVMEAKRWFDSCEEMHLVRDCLKLALADK